MVKDIPNWIHTQLNVQWRIDAFELWCWKRLLRVPWTARRSNQSILKEISPECSLEGLMLKLKLHYFGPLMLRARWLEKTLMLGEIEGKRRRGHVRMRWLNRVTDSVDMNLRKLWGIVEDSEAWCTAIHGVTHSWAWLRDSANSPRLTPRACIPELSDNRIRSLGFPGGASGKESSCKTGNAGDLVWLLCWEDPLKEGVATHSSILAGRTPTGRGAWRATVHGVAKSQIWLKWLSTHTRKSYSEGWAGLWRLWAWHFTNLTRGNEMPHEGNLQK